MKPLSIKLIFRHVVASNSQPFKSQVRELECIEDIQLVADYYK